MKRQTILYILLIFLIISNGFFLVHYLSKKDHKNRKSQFSMIKALDFDEKQMQKFDSLKTIHFDKVKSISKEIGNLKEVMYSKMPDREVPPSFLDSITDLIALEEKKIDLEMFRHFQSVREICNEEQKEKLSKMINDAIKRRGRRGNSKKKE
ncbi:hypothetical protein [Winogradskyella sp.]|uniref:hypothetical protein n=2 Tax=Winogradskyella sp. TaxID=1883156 RepID=UPI003518D336